MFELALQYARNISPSRSVECFETLYAIGGADSALKPVLQPYLLCDLDWWHSDHRQRRAEEKRGRQGRQDQNRARFAANAHLIREGKHWGWLGFAAEVYFDHYHDLDSTAAPRDRLSSYLGEDNAAAAIDGFRALVDDHPSPTIDEILESFGRKKIFLWWLALVAGADARLRAGENLSGLRVEVVEAVITIDLFQMLSQRIACGRGSGSSLLEALRVLYPDVAARIHVCAIEHELGLGAQHPTGLYPFLDEDVFRAARTEALPRLLSAFPAADPHALEQLLRAALREKALHAGLLEQARAALTTEGIGADRLRLWRATAFVLSPLEFKNDVRAALTSDRNEIWALRDFLGNEGRSRARAWPLDVPDLQFLIATMGPCGLRRAIRAGVGRATPMPGTPPSSSAALSTGYRLPQRLSRQTP